MTSQEIKKYIKETAEKLADFLGDNGNQQNIAEGFETILNELTDALENVPSFPPEFIVDLGEIHIKRTQISQQLWNLVKRALCVKVNGLLYPRVAFYDGFADPEGYVDSVFGEVTFDDEGTLDSYTVYKLVSLGGERFEIVRAEA